MEIYLLLSIVGGLLAVDDRVGWQSLLAQPVFTGLLTGFIVGEPYYGLAVGVLLEFVWMSILPMRGTKRPDQVAGAIVGAATAGLLIHTTGDYRVVFMAAMGVFIGLITAEIALWLAQPFFHVKDRKLGRIGFSSLEKPLTAKSFGWIHFLSGFSVFLVEAVVIFILLMVFVNFTEWFTRYASEPIVQGADFWYLLLPVFGIGSLINIFWHKHSIRFLFLSVSLVFLIMFIK